MILSQFRKDIKHVFEDISLIDRLLPVLIVLAMTLGVLLSVFVPGSRNAFQGAQVVNVSIPLAVGLVIMMVPPFCKINWESFSSTRSLFVLYRKAIMISVVLNWIVCPMLMFGLAWLTLFDQDEYRTGIIMIGLLRCIAMVLQWNQIAHGDNTLCTVIVLINSLLQLVLYAPYQIFFCYVITGGTTTDWDTASSYRTVAQSVGFFLGIPLGLGITIRVLGVTLIGENNYHTKLMKFISPWSLIGLLYTIIVIFIEKGDDFIHHIRDAFRCFVPLVLYFCISWFGTFFGLRYLLSMTEERRRSVNIIDGQDEEKPLLCGCDKNLQNHQNLKRWQLRGCSSTYSQVITQTFTASSNNFELSLAIAISIYGSGSKQAIALTFGPLLEVPILLVLAYVARYFEYKLVWGDTDD